MYVRSPLPHLQKPGAGGTQPNVEQEGQQGKPQSVSSREGERRGQGAEGRARPRTQEILPCLTPFYLKPHAVPRPHYRLGRWEEVREKGDLTIVPPEGKQEKRNSPREVFNFDVYLGLVKFNSYIETSDIKLSMVLSITICDHRSRGTA